MKKILSFGILLLIVPIIGYANKRYELFCREQVLVRAINIMHSQVGIREATNRNDGEVLKYLRALGINKPAPYCAAGIWWCFEQARRQLMLPPPDNPLPATAVANDMLAYAIKNGHETNFSPKIFDLIVWKKSNSYRGHIECIVELQNGGFVRTIGFNTSIRNLGKNQEGVFYQKRNIMHPLSRMRLRGIIGFKCV